jgi:hypothetical protein
VDTEEAGRLVEPSEWSVRTIPGTRDWEILREPYAVREPE